MLSIPNKATIVQKKKKIRAATATTKNGQMAFFLRLALVSQQLRLSELFINSSMFVY